MPRLVSSAKSRPKAASVPAKSPLLAEAADILGDQLRAHMGLLADLVSAHAEEIGEKFRNELRKLRMNVRQVNALSAITVGAAAGRMAAGEPLQKFFEEVEYQGRRLAKLNLLPAAIVKALRIYDDLLDVRLRKVEAGERANLRWARDQLQFCVVLTLNNAYYQIREVETKAFYDLFRAELESRNLDEMLARFLGVLHEFCRADESRLYFLDKQENWEARASEPSAPKTAGAVTHSAHLVKLGRPNCVIASEGNGPWCAIDETWKGRFETCWSIPLGGDGEITGVIQFGFKKPYEWLPREQELLAGASERCLLAAEKALLIQDLENSRKQIQQLAEHMLHVEEMERRRISRELHDEAGQSMLCIRLQLEMLEGAMPGELQDLRSRLSDVREYTERTILEIRRLIGALSPAVLEQLGLAPALRQLVQRFRQIHPARVKMDFHRLEGLPKKTEVIVYRLVQECFNNIAKHSGANTVNLSVVSADGILRLSVEDDGAGFRVEDAFARRESFGLAGIRERVALLGGKFEVQSRPRVPEEEVRGEGMAEVVRPARNRVMGLKARGKPGTTIAIELPISREGIR